MLVNWLAKVNFLKLEGDLVRDIARRTGANQIKIVSQKSKRDKECVLKIYGNLKSKQKATTIIIKYLEAFKQGLNVKL